VTVEGSYTANDWGSFQNGNPASGAYLPNPHGQYSESFNPDEEDGFTRRDSGDINIRLNQSLGEDLALRASYTYTRNEAEFKETFVTRLRDDSRTIDRAIFEGKNAYNNDHNLLLDLTGKMDTGSLTHKYIVGVN
jgi:iron complex outermembrane receptor protein